LSVHRWQPSSCLGKIQLFGKRIPFPRFPRGVLPSGPPRGCSAFPRTTSYGHSGDSSFREAENSRENSIIPSDSGGIFPTACQKFLSTLPFHPWCLLGPKLPAHPADNKKTDNPRTLFPKFPLCPWLQYAPTIGLARNNPEVPGPTKVSDTTWRRVGSRAPHPGGKLKAFLHRKFASGRCLR